MGRLPSPTGKNGPRLRSHPPVPPRRGLRLRQPGAGRPQGRGPAGIHGPAARLPRRQRERGPSPLLGGPPECDSHRDQPPLGTRQPQPGAGHRSHTPDSGTSGGLPPPHLPLHPRQLLGTRREPPGRILAELTGAERATPAGADQGLHRLVSPERHGRWPDHSGPRERPHRPLRHLPRRRGRPAIRHRQQRPQRAAAGPRRAAPAHPPAGARKRQRPAPRREAEQGPGPDDPHGLHRRTARPRQREDRRNPGRRAAPSGI